jgi:hypothetical protein
MQKSTKGRRILPARAANKARDKGPAAPLAEALASALTPPPAKLAEAAKPEAKPAEAPKPAEVSAPPKSTEPAGPARRSPERSAHHTMLREFTFPDGRKFTLHRHSVHWATPNKEDPENTTLVGIKGGDKPVPLKIVYADFIAWWRGERQPTPSNALSCG